MSNLSSLSFYISELIIIVGILLVILLDVIPSCKKYTFHISLISILLAGLYVWKNFGATHSLFMGMICIDPFSHFFKIIFLLSTFSIILISRYEKQLDRNYSSEYNALLLIVLLGMFLMSSSINLIMIYLSIELVSIPSYILAGMLKNDKESNEASLKYVIFGSFASGLMLFGLSIIYGLTGSTDIGVVSGTLQTIDYPLTIYFSMILIMVGFGYKISMVPFHFWTPDVYEGAPTPITAFLSIAPKAAGFSILIRIFYTMFTLDGSVSTTFPLTDINWPVLIAVGSAITMTLGNLLAVQQEDVKRLLAYSTISHVGFMLMAFSIISPDAIRAIMLYLFIYLFMNLAAFYMAIFASNKLNAHHINDWNGLGLKNPILSAFMALTLISLTGLPPTAGFVGKFYIFAELFKHQQFYWLAVVAILNSVISLYYYFKIVKSMYLDDVKGDVKKIDAHPIVNWSIIIFSSQNILFFIYWEPLIGFIEKSIKLWTS